MSKQLKNDTPLSRDALAILRYLLQFRYLTPGQISVATGFEINRVAAHLGNLRRRDYVQCVVVKKYAPLFGLRARGMRALGQMQIPQVGVLEFNEPGKRVTDYCRMGIKSPVVMPHTVGCGALAVTFAQVFDGLVLGEGPVGLAERALGRTIGSTVYGQHPDIVGLSGDKVVLVELECSLHMRKEIHRRLCGIRDSEHIGRVAVVAQDPRAIGQHYRLIDTLGLGEKVAVIPCEVGKLPSASALGSVLGLNA